MRQVCIELKLTNVEIVQSRIENYTVEHAYKTVVARAFAPLEKALSQLSNVCDEGGQINIMLGTVPETLPKIEGINNMAVHSIDVPGLSSDRHLLVANK